MDNIFRSIRDALSAPFQTAVQSGEASPEVIAVQDGYKLESLEQYQSAPSRTKLKKLLGSAESFVEYFTRFKEAESSVYLDIKQGLFNGVIDHHGPGEPAWGSHTVSYSPSKSLPWQAWVGVNGQKITQRKLAEFLEERIDDIETPAPADVLDAALKFERVSNFTLASHQNLDDGSGKFHFTKDNASADVRFPHRIRIFIPVFENETEDHFDLRIRYQADDNSGSLSFVISFVKDPTEIVRTRLREIAEDISDRVEAPVYEA